MNNKKYPKGLTLMELLVVVIIISLVMSIGANTYRDQRRQVVFNDSVIHVLNMIKDARNYALTSRSVYDECQILDEDKTYVPAEGYGIYVERSAAGGQSRIVLFANTKIDNDLRSELNQYDWLGSECAPSDVTEESYTLPGDVEFVGLSVNLNTPTHTPISLTTPDKAVIIFRPPLADTILAVNNNTASVTYLNDLYLEFRRPETPASAPSTYIHINKVAGFPEIIKQ